MKTLRLEGEFQLSQHVRFTPEKWDSREHRFKRASDRQDSQVKCQSRHQLAPSESEGPISLQNTLQSPVPYDTGP